MTTNFQELHNTYVQNIQMFPTMLRELSNQLEVSITSLSRIGVGLNPLNEYGMWAWVFPERDAKGNIIGLLERYADGSKMMVKGSKRGLIYEVNNNGQKEYEYKKWTRVSIEFPCPLCGKPDGCMFPEGEYDNPNAIVCVHISEGSTKPLGLGYLHIFDNGKSPNRIQGSSLLISNNLPVLVVEGASDVCAALDLGFTAVGRPSAEGGTKLLPNLLCGKNTVIIGENDSGPGIAGMDKAFIALKDGCSSCVKILPPTGIKDLRQWKIAGLTQQEFLDYIEKVGDSSMSPDIFEDNFADTVTQAWLRSNFMTDGKLLLRKFDKQFIQYNGKTYEAIDDIDLLRGNIYRFGRKKSFVHWDGSVKPYGLSKTKVNDILDACTACCPLQGTIPGWITDGEHPNPKRLMAFQNGLLDIDDYIKGKITLHPPTPDYCSLSMFPYDFDKDAESSLLTDVLDDIFNEDKDKIALLAQWFGYICVPDNSYEKFMLFKGPTRSGKGTLIDALEAMIGVKNCCGVTFHSLAGQFSTQPLLGKLCATMGDARNVSPDQMNRALAWILTITGGGSVSVNRKGVTEIPYTKLYCRFTIAMNDLPAFVDHSRSFEARTNILTFPNSYVDREDKTLKERLKKEAQSGKLINFALRGLVDLHNRKGFIVPEESAMVMRTLREFVSPIVPFVELCIEPDKLGPGVLTDYLYDLWKWWCKREGRNTGFKSTFIRNLLSTMTNTLQIREGEVGNMSRVIMGVRVTEWGQREYLKGE